MAWPSKGFASQKRYIGAGAAIFLLMLVYVWQGHLISEKFTRTFRPAHYQHHLKTEHISQSLLCPRGLGQVRNATDLLTVDVPKVVGLVFYGRRATVSILDCYLKRNLVKNGGVLDEVIWLDRTDDPEDLDLLQKLLDSEPAYVKKSVKTKKQGAWASSYDDIDDNVMYIKIDDDIVYIEDEAIKNIVCTKMQRPDVYVVSANVVNQPLMSWIHWNMGSVRPYLPDTSEYAPPPEGQLVDWRASKLPTWDGPKDVNASTYESPEGRKHRWLPVRGKKHHVLELTPIVDTEYDAFGTGLGHWQIAAQEHYSFLETLEDKEMWKYKYNIWDFQRKRMGIQFIAMMGADINLAKPMGQDDEHWFTVEMPNRLGRSPIADGRGIVAHYSFGAQRTLGTTDILDRYRSYAKENVCSGEMLWSP